MRPDLPSYSVRPLALDDFDKGYLKCLEQLSILGNVTKSEFESIVKFWQSLSTTYFPLVVCKKTEDQEHIVGAGTLVIEHKLIRSCGKAGHIEDIVILESERGKNLGKLLINALTEVAKSQGCYKVILDCVGDKKDFYKKCGYSEKGFQMAFYFE